MFIIGLLYNAQDMLLYYPDQPAHSRIFVESPSTFGLPSEMIYIKGRDGVQISMMFIRQPAEKLKDAPTVIFFHGNAGNIGHRLVVIIFIFVIKLYSLDCKSLNSSISFYFPDY